MIVENPASTASQRPSTDAYDPLTDQTADATTDERPLTGSVSVARSRSQEKDSSASVAAKKNFLTRIFRRKTTGASGDARYQPMKDSDSMSEQVCDDVTWSQTSDAVALGETHMLDDSDITDDAARDNDDIVDRKSSSSSKFFSKYLTSSTSPGAKVPSSTSPLRKLTPTQARRKQQQKYQAFPDELLTDDEDGPAARTGYETLQYYTSDSDNDVTDSAPVAEQDTGATSKRGVKKEGLKLKLMGKSQRGSAQKPQDSKTKKEPVRASEAASSDQQDAQTPQTHAQVARLRDMSGCANEGFRTSLSQGSIPESSSAELLGSKSQHAAHKHGDDGENRSVV